MREYGRTWRVKPEETELARACAEFDARHEGFPFARIVAYAEGPSVVIGWYYCDEEA